MSNLFKYGQNNYIELLNRVASGLENYYTGPWSGRPAADAVPTGAIICITDIGLGNRSWWWSDGTVWRPKNGSVILSSADISSISYTNTTTAEVLGWECIIPEGMFVEGAAIRTMCRASRNVGNSGNWTFTVNFRKVDAGSYPMGNYAASFGTSSVSIMNGQALGVIRMTNSGVARTGGWGFAWSGGASSAATNNVLVANSVNPGPGEATQLFLTGLVPASSTASFSDVLVEFIL